MPYAYVDMADLETDDMIEELESRGLKVIDNEDSGAMGESVKDEIYDLYRDYVTGHNFEKHLKNFFEENLGIVVA